MDLLIQTFKMKGHQGSVTSLDHSSSLPDASFTSSACLLSGSEDGTARLWDLREHLRASLCIKLPLQAIEEESCSRELLSVAFSPSQSISQSAPIDCESAVAKDFSVYLSAGPVVYRYDLRNATSPVETLTESDKVFVAEDEVNEIAVSNNRNGDTIQIALADDTGHITVMNEQSASSIRSLIHDGQALVTAAVFRPSHYKASQLATGGTDCKIMLWDSAKPRKALDSIVIQPLDSNANQVCNPPMINHLSWSPSGKMLAAALGDGSCALLLISNHRSLVLASRLEDAHSGPVASAIYPQWSSPALETHAAADRHDRLLCTAGNDGQLVLWDLGCSLCGDTAADPATLFSGIAKTDEIQQDALLDQPKTLFAWTHSAAKPNWMVSSCGKDVRFPSALFVADTSNDITMYNLPLR